MDTIGYLTETEYARMYGLSVLAVIDAVRCGDLPAEVDREGRALFLIPPGAPWPYY